MQPVVSEWYLLDIGPRGAGDFRGSAGVLGVAIQDLQAWARARVGEGNKGGHAARACRDYRC